MTRADAVETLGGRLQSTAEGALVARLLQSGDAYLVVPNPYATSNFEMTMDVQSLASQAVVTVLQMGRIGLGPRVVVRTNVVELICLRQALPLSLRFLAQQVRSR